MQTKDITQEIILNCSPQNAYDAWLDSDSHGKIIGAQAKIDPKIGGKFDLWDGEMTGKNVTLVKNNLRIVQTWRDNGSDWPKNYYSTITLTFLPDENKKTKLILTQTGIPQEHVKDIENGWKNFYWKPMKEYFQSKK